MFLQLATSAARVSAADEATPELLSEIVAGTVRRLSAPGDAAQLHQLIEAGALTEAAFAAIHLELPLWQIRRITYDEGGWYCAMSQQRELPEWLDEAIETTHASLTLAIVSVYIETLRQIEASRELAGCRYRGHEMINSSWFAAITSPSSLRIHHLKINPLATTPARDSRIRQSF